jgi:CheY-specific phosphatase CheX
MPNPAPYNPWRPKPPQAPIAPTNPAADLRAKFQLAPQHANVEKIATLVKGRENASMDEIAEVISTASGVTQKLVKIAYPKKDARIGATVQMATSRLGVNRVIVVMVGDLLTKAVLETFETMVELPLDFEDDRSTTPIVDHGYLVGSVRFTGETNGVVSLALSPHFALLVAGRTLGGNGDEEHSPETINDMLGELVNIITGNLQSKLCDAGMRCEVSLPQVTFVQALPQEAVAGGSNDRFFFQHGMHSITACLSIDPSAQKPSVLRAPSTQGNSWRANGS